MRLLYEILHRGYKLRNKAPKGPSRLARLFGAKPLPNYSGPHLSLDFLFANTNEHQLTRSNYVARPSTLDFLANYFPGFLFFRLRNVGPKVELRPASFKVFKETYRGLEDLDTNQCPLSTMTPSVD